MKTADLEKQLESMLDIEQFPPPDEFRKQALVQDESLYKRPPRTWRVSGNGRPTS